MAKATTDTPGAQPDIGTTVADVARIPQREQESDERAAYRLLGQAQWLILGGHPSPGAILVALGSTDAAHRVLRQPSARARARCLGEAAGLLFRARELSEVAS